MPAHGCLFLGIESFDLVPGGPVCSSLELEALQHSHPVGTPFPL